MVMVDVGLNYMSRNMAEFKIITDSDSSTVFIEADEDVAFVDWMMACEFLIHKTAQLSSAGYEKALELLCKGAMGYKVTTQFNLGEKK